MKKLSFIPLIALMLLTVFGCSTPQSLTYQDAKNFRIGNISLERPEIGMDLQFYNPNNFGLTMKDANIEVYINNTFIGKATMKNEFAVPANDTFLMPVYLQADIKNVLPNALQILFNKTVDLRLTGNVRAGKGVFLNIPINYQGRQKLNVF